MVNNSESNLIHPIKAFLSRWAVKVITILLTFGLAALLIISLWTVNIAYKNETVQSYKSLPLHDGVSLWVTYPQLLLIDSNPANIVVRLSVKETASFTPPLTVTLSIPPSIALSETVHETWVFTESSNLPVVVNLRNTAILSLTQLQTITLSLTAAQPITTTFTLLDIEVESLTAATQRRFFSGIFNENAPIVLALAFLFPIVSLLIQKYQHEQSQRQIQLAERELDLTILKFDKELDLNAQKHTFEVARNAREQELEEKRFTLEIEKIDHDYKLQEATENRIRDQQKREQREQELKQAPQKISDLRRYLAAGNRRGVQDVWTFITDDILEQTAAPREQVWLKQLVEFCLTGNVTEGKLSVWIDDAKKEFTPELVGAFVAAREEILALQDNYRSVFHQIPLEGVSDLNLRNQFISLWLEV